MIGEKIKELRDYFHITQSAIGKILGVKKQAISMIESNNRGLSHEQIQKLIIKFQIDARWFFEQGIEKIEDADLRNREDSNLTQTELLLREIRELRNQRKPVEDIDPVAHKVMISQPHHNLMQLVRFLDAKVLREIIKYVEGFIAGKKYSESSKGEALLTEEVPPVGEAPLKKAEEAS